MGNIWKGKYDFMENYYKIRFIIKSMKNSTINVNIKKVLPQWIC